jgi:chorismate dehydratase
LTFINLEFAKRALTFGQVLDKMWVGAVSYLNTKPLIYGFEQGEMKEDVHLVLDYPANLSQRINKGELDVALLPIAAIADLERPYIFSNYCIGANGAVASVCLFSEVPLEQVETIYLDYQSRTSVALLKVLVKNHWKKDVKFIQADEGYIAKIKGTTAGLIIGDRAFEQLKNFKHIYDLAAEWKEYTNLPFVFAAWVANKNLPEKFVTNFNHACAIGFEHLHEIIAAQKYPHYDLKTYYTQNISYQLNAEKHKAIELFKQYISKL